MAERAASIGVARVCVAVAAIVCCNNKQLTSLQCYVLLRTRGLLYVLLRSSTHRIPFYVSIKRCLLRIPKASRVSRTPTNSESVPKSLLLFCGRLSFSSPAAAASLFVCVASSKAPRAANEPTARTYRPQQPVSATTAATGATVRHWYFEHFNDSLATC